MEQKLPKLRVQYPKEMIEENAISEVFRHLRALNLEEVRRTVLAGRKKSASHISMPASVFISVAPEEDIVPDGPVLSFLIDCRGLCNIQVYIEPTELDRGDAEQDEVFQRCAAIVEMMQHAPVTEDDEHVFHAPFEFWNRECEEGHDATNWAALAKIWLPAT